jgi:hypothetical protein
MQCAVLIVTHLRWSRARESEADYVSPVGASMYCSPHPAVLHIAPAARLRGFCLYDSAHGEIITTGIGWLADAERYLFSIALNLLRLTMAANLHGETNRHDDKEKAHRAIRSQGQEAHQ